MPIFYLYTSSSILSPRPLNIYSPDTLKKLYLPELSLRRRRRSAHNHSNAILSYHSNANLFKTNRRSRFGDLSFPSDSDDGFYDEDDDRLSDDEFSESEDSDADVHRLKSTGAANRSHGSFGRLEKGRPQKVTKALGIRNGSVDLSGVDRREKQEELKLLKVRFERLADLELDERWLPLLDYLTTFGLKESHFVQMYERHMSSLQINVSSAQERLEYLLSVGVNHTDIKKMLLRQPQILGYTVENNLKSHVAFLMSLGIPHSRLGQIIAARPSLFSYSVEDSLKPTVRYLLEEVGIKKSDLSKVVQLSPQILEMRIDNSWNARVRFFTKEIGAPRDNIVKMVTKHPQLLHYSIEDGLLPRINFLRSIGMRNADILKVSTSLTQVFSLSLEENLKPKYLYLINELRNEVKSLTKYPTYLSLSLHKRIRPRHRFLVSLRKTLKGPFPLGALVPSDESFCQQWAGTSVDKYLAFRQRLLVEGFAKKYERL